VSLGRALDLLAIGVHVHDRACDGGLFGWRRPALEILALTGRGLSKQQIAEALRISVGTVRRHLNHIYDKTDLGGRSQAMRYAIAHGLVSASPEE
jgi:DNA-binding CsgD family transcriptional regulator